MGVVDFFTVLVVVVVNYCLAFFELIVPTRRKSLKGENVLITGGGHGIGRQLALELSKLGTVVVLWDINKETCEKTVADIEEAGGKAYAFVCDVRSSSQIRDVARLVRHQVGEISVLVNNAGILNGAPLMDLDEAGITRTFEVNTLAHFWMIREFLPNMMSKNHGHILNVCSMSSFSGTANLTDYSASKYAALGFSESLIEELAGQGLSGIRVSSLCPMFVDTGLIKTVVDNKVSNLLHPREVALAAIDGMLRNYEIITVPGYFWILNIVGRLFPRKTIQYFKRKANLQILPQYKKSQ